jgi:hypothetical protein
MCVAVYLLVSATPIISNAGDTRGGRIDHIASVNGSILFRIAGGTHSNRPECAATNRYSVPANSPHVEVIKIAFENGFTLGHVRGSGACSLWSNSEDIIWIEVFD